MPPTRRRGAYQAPGARNERICRRQIQRGSETQTRTAKCRPYSRCPAVGRPDPGRLLCRDGSQPSAVPRETSPARRGGGPASRPVEGSSRRAIPRVAAHIVRHGTAHRERKGHCGQIARATNKGRRADVRMTLRVRPLRSRPARGLPVQAPGGAYNYDFEFPTIPCDSFRFSTIPCDSFRFPPAQGSASLGPPLSSRS